MKRALIIAIAAALAAAAYGSPPKYSYEGWWGGGGNTAGKFYYPFDAALAPNGNVSLPAASALPTGLSSLGFGYGRTFTGDISQLRQVRLGGQLDFALPPYVSLGPEITFGFGDAVSSLSVGAETRIYFIPKYDLVVQPHALVGGGYGIVFDFESAYMGYIHFGGGMDFEIPHALMAPYFDMGGLIWVGPGWSENLFSIEGGVRFDVW
jgi:hypothetical protein